MSHGFTLKAIYENVSVEENKRNFKIVKDTPSGECGNEKRTVA